MQDFLVGRGGGAASSKHDKTESEILFLSAGFNLMGTRALGSLTLSPLLHAAEGGFVVELKRRRGSSRGVQGFKDHIAIKDFVEEKRRGDDFCYDI